MTDEGRSRATTTPTGGAAVRQEKPMWVVIERTLDGSLLAHGPFPTDKDALYFIDYTPGGRSRVAGQTRMVITPFQGVRP